MILNHCLSAYNLIILLYDDTSDILLPLKYTQFLCLFNKIQPLKWCSYCKNCLFLCMYIVDFSIKNMIYIYDGDNFKNLKQ